MLRRLLGVLALVAAVMVPSAPAAGAAPLANSWFGTVWSRTDLPVAAVQVARSWIWGPGPASDPLLEPYAEASSGSRVVQYFDKARMEITHPDADPTNPWYVTSGLLAEELVTGRMQLGDNTFQQYAPAQINVAGDAGDPNGPTYASFNVVMSYGAVPDGWTLIQTLLDRAGHVGANPNLAQYNVTAVDVGAPTHHTIASPFWDFMNSSGPVYQNGQTITDKLFQNPFYATGYPLTEAYWAQVPVGGAPKQVLMQIFERRVLTYTPSNPDGWQVEAGNVGQHYQQWRYGQLGQTPQPAPVHAPVIVLDPGHDPSTGGALGIEEEHTLRTALLTRDALQSAGYTVYLTRSDESTVLYGDRSLMPPNAASMPFDYVEGYAHATRVLQFQPDLVISIHYNASDSSGAAGLTVFYCDHGGSQNAVLAGYLAGELDASLRTAGYSSPYAAASEDGTIGKSYGHLATIGNVYSAPFAFQADRMDGIPAVLTEALFETNPAERALIERDDVQRLLAQAYLRAVNRYFGR